MFTNIYNVFDDSAFNWNLHQILVENGQKVKAGEVLMLIEAMKMEVSILQYSLFGLLWR